MSFPKKSDPANLRDPDIESVFTDLHQRSIRQRQQSGSRRSCLTAEIMMSCSLNVYNIEYGNFETRQVRTPGSNSRKRFGLRMIASMAVSTVLTNLLAVSVIRQDGFAKLVSNYLPFSSSPRFTWNAALMSAMWVKACGKLPKCSLEGPSSSG